jgi:hypothetical protein
VIQRCSLPWGSRGYFFFWCFLAPASSCYRTIQLLWHGCDKYSLFSRSLMLGKMSVTGKRKSKQKSRGFDQDYSLSQQPVRHSLIPFDSTWNRRIRTPRLGSGVSANLHTSEVGEGAVYCCGPEVFFKPWGMPWVFQNSLFHRPRLRSVKFLFFAIWRWGGSDRDIPFFVNVLWLVFHECAIQGCRYKDFLFWEVLLYSYRHLGVVDEA